jgi:hypothetical protein
LDQELRRDGIEMITPHRSNRIKPAHPRSASTQPICHSAYNLIRIPKLLTA